MCWWCKDPSCLDGEKCYYRQNKSLLLNSRTFKDAVRRIECATGKKVAYAPGMPWNGLRPAFVPGIRDAVMGGTSGTGGLTCSLCQAPIQGTSGHADHVTPWQSYTEQSARSAMREHGQNWMGGAIPDDFARVMSSDPRNLQPAHARCNEEKSDSMPGRPAGAARRERREQQAREEARRREEERRRIERQQQERAERARQWGSRWG